MKFVLDILAKIFPKLKKILLKSQKCSSQLSTKPPLISSELRRGDTFAYFMIPDAEKSIKRRNIDLY